MRPIADVNHEIFLHGSGFYSLEVGSEFVMDPHLITLLQRRVEGTKKDNLIIRARHVLFVDKGDDVFGKALQEFGRGLLHAVAKACLLRWISRH
jgi:hypothetical protein